MPREDVAARQHLPDFAEVLGTLLLLRRKALVVRDPIPVAELEGDTAAVAAE